MQRSESGICTFVPSCIEFAESIAPLRIKTNATPSHAQRELLRSALYDLKTQISLIEKHTLECSCLQDFPGSQRALEQAIADLTQSTSDHNTILSPICLLPTELLSQIFITTLPDDPKTIREHRSIPLTLSHVSATWRNIAITTPQLWIRIVAFPTEASLLSDIAIVLMWLARSAEAPLDIVIRSDEEQDIGSFISAIMPHSYRWRHLTLRCPASVISHFGPARSRLWNLETFDASSWGSEDLEGADIFADAPRLRNVLAGRFINFRAYQFPWRQIEHTRLWGEGFTLEDCFEVIRQTPNLKTAMFSVKPQLLDVITAPLRLLHLTSLYIFLLHPFKSFVEHVELPALRRLGVEDKSQVSPFSELHSALSRVGGSLETLSIKLQVPISSDQLQKCLELAPNLTRLTLRGISSLAMTGNTIARLLSSEDSNKCLLPKLQALRFTNFNSVSFESLLTMVESRLDASLSSMPSAIADALSVSPIMTIGIEISAKPFDKIGPATLLRLQKLSRKGFTLDVADNENNWPRLFDPNTTYKHRAGPIDDRLLMR